MQEEFIKCSEYIHRNNILEQNAMFNQPDNVMHCQGGRTVYMRYVILCLCLSMHQEF